MGQTFVDKLLLQIEIQNKQASSQLKEIDQVMEDIEFGIEKVNKKANGLKKLQAGLMGAGLSFLFTGMAIKRLFQTGLNALASTYLLVEGENGAVQESINELHAQWLAFKYDIVDNAAISGSIQRWIDLVTELLDAFSDLPSPVQDTIFNLMVVGVILGSILMIVGQMMLGFLGVTAFVAAGLLVPMLIFFVIIGSIIALIAIWNSDMSTTEKILWTLVVVLIVAGIILALLVSPWFLILIVIGIVIAAIIMFRKEIALAFLTAGKYIQEGFIDMINWAIKKLNFLIELMNKIPGVNIGTMALIDEGAGIDFNSRIAGLQGEINGNNNGGFVGPMPQQQTDLTQNFNIGGSVLSDMDLRELVRQSVDGSVMFNGGSPQL